MLELIEVIKSAMERTLSLASCETVVPIYTSVIYDGTCHHSINSIMWMFDGFLIAGVFGLFMLTLRTAYKPNRYLTPVEYDQEQDLPDGRRDGDEGHHSTIAVLPAYGANGAPMHRAAAF